MEEIIISNNKRLEEIKDNIKIGGSENFHVIADFDRTLTKGIVGNSKTTAIINRLAMGGYISPDYTKKANALFDKYYPIEQNSKIPLEERCEKMEEWWNQHNQLLVESGLDLNVIKKVIKNEDPYFREGVFELLEFLHEKNIPLIIMSASKGELIQGFLEKYDKMYSNIHIIANFFVFDKEGKATSYVKPVIHSLNKKEATVKNLPIYNELIKRKNVLLLGDSVGDVEMIEGFPYENLIKMGFLNDRVDENLERFKQKFDMVLLGDGSFKPVNDLVKEIV